MHDFRKLDVYRRALQYSVAARKVTRAFPKHEMFVLSSQFIRAADSIVLNIAEGAGCHSPKEFARFLGISIRSAYECCSCIDIATLQSYVDSMLGKSLNDDAEEIVRMLIGLQRSLFRERVGE